MAARHSQIVKIVEIRQKLTEQVAKLDYIRNFENNINRSALFGFNFESKIEIVTILVKMV